MPRPISEDLRRVVVRLYATGSATYDDIAEMLGIGGATVGRVLRLDRTTGSVAPKPARGGPTFKLDDACRTALMALVDAEPDATIDELRAKWAATRPDRTVSSATVWREINRAGITLKKSRSARKS